MLIIIEGPDRVGKDSLISRLSLNIAQIHCGTPKLKSKDYFYGFYTGLYQAIDKSSNDTVLNRSSLGEYVYGPLYRNNHYELQDIVDPFSVIHNHCIKIFTLIDSPETLLSREDGESFGKDLQAKIDEVSRFVAITEYFNGNVINCDGKTKEEIYLEVMEKILND